MQYIFFCWKEGIMSRKYEKEAAWNQYMHMKSGIYQMLYPELANDCMISEANWKERNLLSSSSEFGIHARKGDICYMDFGQAYLNEIGFQHFAIIMSIYNLKALCIPMTSNIKTLESAYDPKRNPYGKKHLMKIGKIEGMAKPSVLFLNDVKYVNTARIIDVKAHLDPDSKLFHDIQQRMLHLMVSDEEDNSGSTASNRNRNVVTYNWQKWIG